MFYLARAPYVRVLLALVVGFVLYADVYMPRLALPELLETLLFLVLIYVLLDIATDATRRSATFIYRKRNGYDAEYTDIFILGMRQLSLIVTIGLFIIIVIELYLGGIRHVLTSLALFSVFTAIIFKEALQNFFAGIGMMFSGELRMRDYVKIGEHKGRITSISFQRTKLLTDTSDIVVVPNHHLQQQAFINYSKLTTKNTFVTFALARDELCAYHAIKERIEREVPAEFEDLLQVENAIRFTCDEFTRESVTYSVEYKIPTFSFKTEIMLRNKTLAIVADEVVRVNTECAH